MTLTEKVRYILDIMPDAEFEVVNCKELVWTDDRPIPLDSDIENKYRADMVAKTEDKTTSAIDDFINDVAIAHGYTNMMSARSYVGFENPFQADCLRLANWSSDCWVKAGAIKQDVLDGNRDMPTIAQVLSELPELVE